MPDHPFAKSYNRLGIAKIEFDFFKSRATPAVIQDQCDALPRFKPLKDIYSFYIDNKDPRPPSALVWKAVDVSADPTAGSGRGAGPRLLYSLGPTGVVAIALYPATSDLASIETDAEKLISRRRFPCLDPQ